MSKQIASCPYCMSEQLQITSQHLAHHVQCQRCKASGPRRRYIEDAIEDWNGLSNQLRRNDDFYLPLDYLNQRFKERAQLSSTNRV